MEDAKILGVSIKLKKENFLKVGEVFSNFNM